MLGDRRRFWRGVREFALGAAGGGDGDVPLTADKVDEFNRHFAGVGSAIAAELTAEGGSATPVQPRPPCVTTARLALRPATLPELSAALGELSSSRVVGLDDVPILAVRKCFDVIGPVPYTS